MMTWIAVGTALQIAMVVAGHFIPPLRAWWGPGGMLISLVVGCLAAQTRWSQTLVAGALAGGVGAFVGILIALLLGDVPAMLLALGTISSVVAGVIGAAVVTFFRRRGEAAA
jgi:uncharacterized membrane protein YeaQ/YmgE (transglycosylase-associated protein family)